MQVHLRRENAATHPCPEAIIAIAAGRLGADHGTRTCPAPPSCHRAPCIRSTAPSPRSTGRSTPYLLPRRRPPCPPPGSPCSTDPSLPRLLPRRRPLCPPPGSTCLAPRPAPPSGRDSPPIPSHPATPCRAARPTAGSRPWQGCPLPPPRPCRHVHGAALVGIAMLPILPRSHTGLPFERLIQNATPTAL